MSTPRRPTPGHPAERLGLDSRRVNAPAVLISDLDLVLLAHLAHAGLPVVERRDGGVNAEAYRLITADLVRAAGQVSRRIEREARRSAQVSETRRAPASFPRPSSDPTQWPTTAEASEQFGVSEQYLRELARERLVKAERRGHGYRFDPNSLTVWALGRAKKGSDQQAA